MAHVGVFCPPIPGHLNPLAALGRAVQRRGHRVTFFQLAGLQKRIETEQLGYYPLGANSRAVSELANAVAELGRRTGLSAARFTLDCGRRLTETVCQYGPDAVRGSGVELLLVDDDMPAGGTVAEHLAMPFVSVGLTPLHRDAAVPPTFVPWPYDPGLLAVVRNQIAYSFLELLIRPMQKVLNRYRAAWKLPRIARPDQTLSRLAQLTQLIAELDFPRTEKPACLHYLGPLIDGERPGAPFPFDRLNGKPLIYASLGTVQNRRPEHFQTIVEACEPLNAQVVISTGGSDVSGIRAPNSAIVVPYAPQLELLGRASLCITHAGLNTVMECLRAGVPMVCVPITNDQPGIAARVRWAGAGEVVPLRKLAAGALREQVDAVLGNPAYRDKARSLASSVEKAGGAERGADIVSALLSRPRVHSAAASI